MLWYLLICIMYIYKKIIKFGRYILCHMDVKTMECSESLALNIYAVQVIAC